MRDKVPQQRSLTPVYVDHEHARELAAVSDILDELPELLDLVHADLTRSASAKLGRRGLAAEQVLRLLVLKQMTGFSYAALAFHLVDSASYRAFCRVGVFSAPLKKSRIHWNVKALRGETLEKINRLLVAYAGEKLVERGRKVRVDSTVVESNIREPVDSSLLWDDVRVLTRLMKEACATFGDHMVDHSRQAKRLAFKILNSGKRVRVPLYSSLIKVTEKTIRDAGWIAEALDGHAKRRKRALAVHAGLLAAKLRHFADLGRRVVSQARRRIINEEKVPSAEKVVSIFETHTAIIVKDCRSTQYGHKVFVTTGASSLILDCVIADEGNPADATMTEEMIDRQKVILGRAPRQAAFDGSFTSRANLEALKAKGVGDVAFSKARGLEVHEMVKSRWVYRELRKFRAGVEGCISFLKRCFGLGRCTWRTLDSFKAYVWGSIVSANLVILARYRLA